MVDETAASWASRACSIYIKHSSYGVHTVVLIMLYSMCNHLIHDRSAVGGFHTQWPGPLGRRGGTTPAVPLMRIHLNSSTDIMYYCTKYYLYHILQYAGRGLSCYQKQKRTA